jgi:hypothetical protein
MSTSNPQARMVERRAAQMAELFSQRLDATDAARDMIAVPLTQIDDAAKARLREELAAWRSEALAA